MDTPQLPEEPIRVYRTVGFLSSKTARFVWPGIFILVGIGACTTLPSPKFSKFSFPKNAFIDPITREYEKIGTVRAKVNFPTLDPSRDEDALCRNYFNKAVSDLVLLAEKKGADAVIEVRSVVFYEGAKSQVFLTPECSDDGEEGQALAQGIAVKWKPKASPSPSSSPRDPVKAP